MSNAFDIFTKIKKQNKNNVILSKQDIIKSIPENYLKESDENLCETQTEWRWRFFKLPNKNNEVVEISFKKPNESRMFIDRNGKWVIRNIDNSYNKFLISEHYVYTQ